LIKSSKKVAVSVVVSLPMNGWFLPNPI